MGENAILAKTPPDKMQGHIHRNILIGVCQGPTTAELSSIPTIDGIVDYDYKTILHSCSTPFNLD